MLPILVVGLFFKDSIESVFGSGPLLVGILMWVTAALLFLSERVTRHQDERGIRGKAIGYKEAFLIGLSQACAVLPGLSRSGTTISTGLICGVRRDVMAQFSFLMVLVPILGEAFLETVGGGFAESAVGALPLLLGFLSAFVSGLLACKVMIALVKKAKLSWFALYCVLAALSIFIFA